MHRPDCIIRAMAYADLPSVMAIEELAYSHPWSERAFRDCLGVGYPAWVLTSPEGQIWGYALATMAVGEAHVLNIAVAERKRGQGLAGRLLEALLQRAARESITQVFLEVRPSNGAARALYERYDFEQVGRRPDYYPGTPAREDALLLARSCQPLA